MSRNLAKNSECIRAIPSYSVLCNTTVNCEKRFRVTKHRESAKHQRFLHVLPSTTTTTKQLFLPRTKKDFKAKLVEAFLAADIPLKKLQSSHIRELFTNLGQAVPSESVCRAHVETLAEQEMDNIKKKLAGKDIFMVVDESEVLKNKYINVLVGDADEPEKTYIVDCSIVETVNQHFVAAKIDDCIKKLDAPRSRFMLLLSDAASYMMASSAALKLLYPNLFHVTCTAHPLHNCAEKVRSHFKDVDN